MTRAVTFRQLEQTLTAFGFKAQSQDGGHVIFRHAKTGLLLSVPNIGRTVRPIYVATAARQVENFGIATTAAFESKLERTARDAA